MNCPSCDAEMTRLELERAVSAFGLRDASMSSQTREAVRAGGYSRPIAIASRSRKVQHSRQGDLTFDELP